MINQRGGARRPTQSDYQRAQTAARAAKCWLNNPRQRTADVARRHNITTSAMRLALRIMQHHPHLAAQILAGQLTLNQAINHRENVA